MITVLRTWALAVAAAVGDFLTNWRIDARWVFPFQERIYRMTGRRMGGP